ncbi:hypothetical protein BC828DRAFT_399662 [Blastocladiella britannica]|nr:hypothetical protein BC828DRAFT_399662 [Blastocladiella britannica]
MGNPRVRTASALYASPPTGYLPSPGCPNHADNKPPLHSQRQQPQQPSEIIHAGCPCCDPDAPVPGVTHAGGTTSLPSPSQSPSPSPSVSSGTSSSSSGLDSTSSASMSAADPASPLVFSGRTTMGMSTRRPAPLTATSSLTASLRAHEQAQSFATALAATESAPSSPRLARSRSGSTRSVLSRSGSISHQQQLSLDALPPSPPMFFMSPPPPPPPAVTASLSSSVASSTTVSSSMSTPSRRGAGLGLVRMQSFRAARDLGDDSDTSDSGSESDASIPMSHATSRSTSVATLSSALGSDSGSESDGSSSTDSEVEYLRSRGLAPPARRHTHRPPPSAAVRAPAAPPSSRAHPATSSSVSSSASPSTSSLGPRRGVPVHLALANSSLGSYPQSSSGLPAVSSPLSPTGMSSSAARVTRLPTRSLSSRAPPGSPSVMAARAAAAASRPMPPASPTTAVSGGGDLSAVAASLGMPLDDLRTNLRARFADLHGLTTSGSTPIPSNHDDAALLAMFRALMLLPSATVPPGSHHQPSATAVAAEEGGILGDLSRRRTSLVGDHDGAVLVEVAGRRNGEQ